MTARETRKNPFENSAPFERASQNAFEAAAENARRSPAGSSSLLERFLGGRPAAVFLRLLFTSMLVGAVLMWLNIRPYRVYLAIQNFARDLWMMGWDAIGDMLQYAMVGAALVIPCWVVLRLLNMRGDR